MGRHLVRVLVLASALLASFALPSPRGGPREAHAEEAWEAEALRAVASQDRELDEARQRGTTRQLVSRYASRVSRQPTALNHFLLGRALYHDGDVDGAERQLLRALQLQPDFYLANLRLAMLELQRKNVQAALRHIQVVRQRRPREPSALKLLAQIYLDAKDWDRALQVLEDLLSQEPTNDGVRRNIAFVLMAKEDWDRALKELRILRGRSPRDPVIRWYYATALYQTAELKEAVRELEGLVRMNPQDIRALDLLRLVYWKLEDWKSLQKTLERMLPLVGDEEMEAQIREVLKALEEGGRPGQQPTEEGASWPENPWMQLIEMAMDPDVEVRRKALQEYHLRNFPRMPHALVSRVHPDHEPDAICRQWLLRIMGQMQHPQLAQVAAYALYDPEPAVRARAAETLGEIATPSGLLYLLPVFLGVELAEAPSAEVVELQNACRRGMIGITGRLDVFGGLETWVDGGELGRLRKDWLDWLESPDGIHIRLRAIQDLDAQEDLRPELHVLEDVSDPNPEIAKAAYTVLLKRSKLPSEDAVAKAMWPRFPVFEESQFTEEGLGQVRLAVTQWWEAWVKMRAEQQARAGDSGGGR